MRQEKYIKLNNIVILTLLGSLVRLAYAYVFMPWEQAPDQLAWEILLDHVNEEGAWTYANLIHYPHEGRTVLISLISLLVKQFTSFQSLVIVTFILDFLTRYIQLFIVQKIFEPRVSLLFGLWMIFALPSLIPWGTLAFGGHAVSSFFPFVLLYLLWKDITTVRGAVGTGVFLGFAIWFSYSNIILIPVCFGYFLFRKEKSKQWMYIWGGLTIVLLAHLAVRTYADEGFHLANFGLSSIRGTEFSLTNIQMYANLILVWFQPLLGASMLSAGTFSVGLRVFWGLFVFLGLYGFFRSYQKQLIPKRVAINIFSVLFFLILYAISPFYINSIESNNYVVYRQFTYILPLLVLFVIQGLFFLKHKDLTLTVFLLLGVYGTIVSFTSEPSNKLLLKPAGWVLGAKFGHDPKVLSNIIEGAAYDQTELIEGVGWGLSAHLFEGVNATNLELVERNINMLSSIVAEFPESNKALLIKGVEYSFSEEVTPRLDKALLDKVLLKLN